MKRTYKYLSVIALGSLMSVFTALSADAQHRGGGGGGSQSSGGGGGGGSHSSGGGGGVSVSRPSSSGSSGGYRPTPSVSTNNNRPSVGISRPSSSSPNVGYRPGSGSYPHVAISPPRINSQGIRPPVNHLGVTGNVNRGFVNPATHNYVGTRGYVGAGGRGAVGPGGRGFYPPTYWRNHGYYHYYHGYYGTYYAPRIGFSIGFLPYGYYPFWYGDYQYYYSGGLFYTYDNNEYTVVEPPVGAEVTELPSNAQSIMINGEQYYEANGVYYEPITKDDGTTSYQVAGKDGELNTNEAQDVQQAPQVGDMVETLPPDCRKINLNGEKFYVSPDGYYYQEARDANNNKVYKVVGTPSDEPDSQ